MAASAWAGTKRASARRRRGLEARDRLRVALGLRGRRSPWSAGGWRRGRRASPGSSAPSRRRTASARPRSPGRCRRSRRARPARSRGRRSPRPRRARSRFRRRPARRATGSARCASPPRPRRPGSSGRAPARSPVRPPARGCVGGWVERERIAGEPGHARDEERRRLARAAEQRGDQRRDPAAESGGEKRGDHKPPPTGEARCEGDRASVARGGPTLPAQVEPSAGRAGERPPPRRPARRSPTATRTA